MRTKIMETRWAVCDSSGNRYDEQYGVASDGAVYRRARRRPSADEARNNEGDRRDNFLARNPDREWSPWRRTALKREEYYPAVQAEASE